MAYCKSEKELIENCREQVNEWFIKSAIPKLHLVWKNAGGKYNCTKFHMLFDTQIDIN
jgi:hypothetical protein